MSYSKLKRKPIHKINIDKPKYCLDLYAGRLRHFLEVANPINILATNGMLERAKKIVETQRRGRRQNPEITTGQLYRSKILYDSAYHPETSEKQILIGRMSAQVPINILMPVMFSYLSRSKLQMILGLFVYQGVNSIVYYSNRSGRAKFCSEEIIMNCMAGTTAAVAATLLFNRLTRCSSYSIRRFVPFIGYGIAHCVNCPLTRNKELRFGTTLYDERGKIVGCSRNAARKGIAQVILTRFTMAAPAMLAVPMLMEKLKKARVCFRKPFVVELALLGLCYAIAIPMSLAIFKQEQHICYKNLEEKSKEQIKKNKWNVRKSVFYFNKGL